MEIKTYLGDRRVLVEAFLKEYFSRKAEPALLSEAMNYSLSAGGKRIRPVLCIAAYEVCGGDATAIVPYASAIEFVHTYSLIHDDLPAMDDDDLRRGKPTNHKVYGEAVAILAGDALLTEAFSILSEPAGGIGPEQLLRSVHELSAASGMKGMVAGQVQDMLSENAEPDEATLRFIHRHKTAALLSASVRMGAILGQAGPELMQALSGYGENIGLAFQVVDDILDVTGETSVIGKPKGSDEKKKKLTYPRLFGLDRSRLIAEELITAAKDALGDFGQEADPLRGIASYLLSRSH